MSRYRVDAAFPTERSSRRPSNIAGPIGYFLRSLTNNSRSFSISLNTSPTHPFTTSSSSLVAPGSSWSIRTGAGGAVGVYRASERRGRNEIVAMRILAVNSSICRNTHKHQLTVFCVRCQGTTYVPHFQRLGDPPRRQSRRRQHQTRRDPERAQREQGRDPAFSRAYVGFCRVGREEGGVRVVEDLESGPAGWCDGRGCWLCRGRRG